MTVGCKLCSGIQAQIKAAENGLNEMKGKAEGISTELKSIRDEIARRPSTKTLIAIAGVLAVLMGIVASAAFLSNQSQLTTLQQQVNAHYSSLKAATTSFGQRLDSIQVPGAKPAAPKPQPPAKK